MKRIQTPAFRYGEREFDIEYAKWGFHDEQTQLREAESVLRIAQPAGPLRVLDLACGRGVHAVEWAARGHQVTGVDISETFLRMARERAAERGVKAEFVVADVEDFTGAGFDLVTWIEGASFTEAILAKIHRWLRAGGRFLADVRNPESPRFRRLNSNWRDWHEANGAFHLERHETNPETGERENVWVTIDPAAGTIEERREISLAVTLSEKMAILEATDFIDVELRTIGGEPFRGGEEPYWLWLTARKP
ncbi:MAG TPA: class I SAM-dependent methyltransferase [Phycisphaerae bacterium]|nr:class I SAM-dependent methyltransferase [Phycisphaerae bacterium]